MSDFQETRDFWNRTAGDWRIQVGDDGDTNRILNSDPVLWDLAGEVRGRRVLDAGCGTGYLSAKMRDRGAVVTGVDFSERMIALAREHYPGIEFVVDSCSELASQPDGTFDLIVSNYVLMDTPDLEGTVGAFHRVLRPGGIAVAVFSHPCFPQGDAARPNGEEILYRWSHSYFERHKRVDRPWAHFTSNFIWFHRPLSDYWKVFDAAGFAVTGFEEPRIQPERYHLAASPGKLRDSMTRPNSVAFRLRKNEL